MNLEGLISKLTELSKGEEVKEADVAAAIQAEADKVYHTIFRSGFKESEERAETKLEKLRGEVEDTKSKLEKAQATSKELEKNKGKDPEAITAKYEQALTAKDEQITALEAKLKETETEYTGKLSSKALDSFRGRVLNEAIALGVDPEIAKAKVQLMDLSERVEVGDDYEVSRVLQPDGATPYPLNGDRGLHEFLAAEVFESTPERLREDKRQSGSRVGERGGTSGARFSEKEIANMSDAEYEKHREEIFRANAEGRITN